MSAFDQSTASGLIGCPPRLTKRPWPARTVEASRIAGKPAAPVLRSCGHSSCTFMPARHAPGGMKDDELHVGGKDWRRCAGFADHNLFRQLDLSPIDDPRHLLGHAVPDIKLAEIIGGIQRQRSRLAIRRRTVFGRAGVGRGGAGRQQRLAQARELLVAWVELAQIGGDVGMFGNGEQERARVIDGRLLVELPANRGGIQRPPRAAPAYLRMAKLSLISAAASASTSVGGAPSWGSSKAEVLKPQLSA